jgi:hypothetical protein
MICVELGGSYADAVALHRKAAYPCEHAGILPRSRITRLGCFTPPSGSHPRRRYWDTRTRPSRPPLWTIRSVIAHTTCVAWSSSISFIRLRLGLWVVRTSVR